jgi:hypothetical protein
MLIALAVLVGAGVIAWAVIRASRVTTVASVDADAAKSRQLALLSAFAPAVAAAAHDPKVIATWQPVVKTAKALFPAEFAALEKASGATFPFSGDLVRQAHATWTTEWLVWERSHDAEFKRRAAAAHVDPNAPMTAATRAVLDAIENEKLELYQRRYAEYVKIAKALQAIGDS